MNNQTQKIIITTPDSYYFIYIQSITMIECFQNYCKIHLDTDEVILSTNNLRFFEEKLNTPDFYKCHRSYLINLNHLKSLNKNGKLTLHNQKKINVSRRKLPMLKEIVQNTYIGLLMHEENLSQAS